MTRAATRRKARIDREYEELRAIDPDLFRQCVEAAEGIGINHRLNDLLDAPSHAILADIEQALVSIALRSRR